MTLWGNQHKILFPRTLTLNCEYISKRLNSLEEQATDIADIVNRIQAQDTGDHSDMVNVFTSPRLLQVRHQVSRQIKRRKVNMGAY